MSTPTQQLHDQGVSIWLDDLSRRRITTGNLADLIANRNVTGITTNPTIFANAISHGEGYGEQIADLAAQKASVDEAIFQITTTDVRNACDVMKGVYDSTAGVDGRVSIEVSPDVAHDTDASIAQAAKLWKTVDRANAYIKIPATKLSLPAITASIAAGISVNVTLIFSLARYQEVIDAYLAGLEQAKAAGRDLSKIFSVASFFVSRVDVEVDKRLDALGSDAAAALRSKAGIANARLAYEVFEKAFAGSRAKELLAAGANTQRPLWASTGTKDPALPDTLYVTELVAPDVVNTMPEKTMEAVFDHGVITGDTVTGAYAAAHETMAGLAAVGIDIDEVTQLLEDQGIEKFLTSWNGMRDSVRDALAAVPNPSR